MAVVPLPRRDPSRGSHPAGTARTCSAEGCRDVPVVQVLRHGARKSRPVCDRHAHVEVLEAERFSYGVTLTALPGWRPAP